MNIYYLKKFRKKAKKAIKARYNPSNKYPYHCVEKGWYINNSISKDLFELQQKLSECRKDYILQLAQAKKAKKLNKQLVKL